MSSVKTISSGFVEATDGFAKLQIDIVKKKGWVNAVVYKYYTLKNETTEKRSCVGWFKQSDLEELYYALPNIINVVAEEQRKASMQMLHLPLNCVCVLLFIYSKMRHLHIDVEYQQQKEKREQAMQVEDQKPALLHPPAKRSIDKQSWAKRDEVDG